ncbi:MAG TPA: metallopeptidase family protein [Candidatus Dormibacteraeota bacterium]
MKVSMDQFEAAVGEAIDSIPAEFQPYLENTEFLIAESSPEGLLGLYEGGGALDDGWPQRVTVFKREHERSAADWEELVAEVRRTILHEVGHHFGMDEADLPF